MRAGCLVLLVFAIGVGVGLVIITSLAGFVSGALSFRRHFGDYRV